MLYKLLSCAIYKIPIKYEGVMELTDSQVLSQLKIKRATLKIELERVDIAIRAFEDIGELEELDVLPYMEQPEDFVQGDEELSVAKLMYNPRMSREKKVLYVLSKIRQGDISAIANYLMRVDTTIHPRETQAIFDRLTWVASRMYKAKKIGAYKEGKKNIYKLLD